MKNENKHRNKIQAPRSPKGETAGIVFKTLFLCLILGTFVGIFLIAMWVDDVLADTPELDMTNIGRGQSALIFDQDGELIFEFGEQRSEWVPFDEISEVMIDAILAIEDSRYFEHYGVDWTRTLQAVRYTLESMLMGSDSMQGGSTLTQQLVNQTHLLIEDEEGEIIRDNSIPRKVQEIYLAMEVERQLSKEQIIEAYLNIAPFGGRIYGIQAAAEFYFGVDARHLTLSQAATLAGIVQQPSVFRPDTGANYTQYRRNTVLGLMVRHGFISQTIADLAAAEPITDLLVYSTVGLDNIQVYQPFIDLAREEAERRFGITDLSGFQIHTTLDRDAQRYVTELLGNDGGFHWPNQHMQTSVAMIRNDGAIRALAHRDEINTSRPAQRGFHPAVHGGYQVGSASKPIWAYGPAFELLDWGTGSMVTDDLFAWGGVGAPLVGNWDFRFRGRDSVRESMVESWNIPAIITYQEVVRLRGQEALDEFVNNLGIPTPPDGFRPSYAIGGMEHGASPLQMAGAYAAFANGGVFHEPFVITYIIAPDGTRIEGDDYRRVERVMSEGSAYMMNSILRSSIFGDGAGRHAQQVQNQWVAGKTGTTNFDDATRAIAGVPWDAIPDAWFVGYSLDYTVAVWTGFESLTSGHYLSNARLETHIPVHIFTRIMNELGTPGSPAPVRPDTIWTATVEWRSGTAEGEACSPTANTPANAVRPNELFHSHNMPNCVSNRFGGTLAAPNNFRGNALGGRRIEFSWDHDGEGGSAGTMSLSQARAAYERGMALFRGNTVLTQEMANLPIKPGAARMLIDEIQGGAGEMRYEVIGVRANGSTTVLGTTTDEELTVTLSVGDAFAIRSFHVVARLGNRSTPQSNSVQRVDLIRDADLEITIPDMRNRTETWFNEWLRDHEASDEIRHEVVREYSATVPEGQIISTNPTGRLRLDQTLRVVISRGPQATTPAATNPPGGGGGLPPMPGLPGATQPTAAPRE